MSKIINTNTCIRRQDVNKVNSKSMSVTFFTCRYYYILTDFLHCFSSYFVDFEHVII